jgi:hypothetical protein
MRLIFAVLVAASLSLLAARPAAASCALPASAADNTARAVAVIHGAVTQAGGGALTVRVDRVLKGQASAEIRVFVGPARGAATSVDYAATQGSDHVLYLIRGSDGQLETNACIGSHSGQATADETATFGTVGSPAPGSRTELAPIPGTAFPSIIDLAPLWLALGVVGAAAVTLVLRRRRAHIGE